MDWTTVGSVLGSNFFIAVVSLATARWQINNTKEQLDKQLQSEGERDRTERRREVRSEPLLRFRAELAQMAAKYERAVKTAQMQHTRFGISEEDARKLFEKANKDFNDYMERGDLARTIFMLDDAQIVDKMEEIVKDYRQSAIAHMEYKHIGAENLKEAMGVYKRNIQRIAELQNSISQKLESL